MRFQMKEEGKERGWDRFGECCTRGDIVHMYPIEWTTPRESECLLNKGVDHYCVGSWRGRQSSPTRGNESEFLLEYRTKNDRALTQRVLKNPYNLIMKSSYICSLLVVIQLKIDKSLLKRAFFKNYQISNKFQWKDRNGQFWPLLFVCSFCDWLTSTQCGYLPELSILQTRTNSSSTAKDCSWSQKSPRSCPQLKPSQRVFYLIHRPSFYKSLWLDLGKCERVL